jgi:transposase
MSLISAISEDRIISNQIVEGAVDGMLFENFIYHTLLSIRNNKDLCERKVVIFLDNATIHKTKHLYDTAMKFKVIILFNAAYSPWLNPVEQFFRYLKMNLKSNDVNTK